jgi:hypothetical protein
MELCTYIAKNGKVLVLTPRYISSQKVADCLLKRVGNDCKTIILNSEVSHLLHNLSGYDLIIYIDINDAINARTVNNIANQLIIIEWGTDPSLFSKAQKWAIDNGNPLSRLKTGFITNVRAIYMNLFGVYMGSNMAKWYKDITHSDASRIYKDQAGNHYYSGHTIDENKIIITHNHHIDHTNPQEEETKPDKTHCTTLHALLEDEFDELDSEKLRQLEPKDSQLSLSDNSPKMDLIINEYKTHPCKYVIFTHYNKAHGLRLFEKLLKSNLDTEIFVISPANYHKSKRILHEFNSSDKGILLTSIIPDMTLVEVDKLFIIDSFKPDTTRSLIKLCCAVESGKSDETLEIILLHVKSQLEEETYDEKRVKELAEYLEHSETTYAEFEQNAQSILFKSSKLVVV